ncbi:MAG: PIN domain-containing protein [Chloroherpetonaceae bacterium]|nr:PIN domain-containing protein [Chloroherpetonaceae bacterium]
MKLLDTNILLEILLGQKRAEVAKAYINAQDAGSLFLSSYSLDSIGLKLFWAGKIDAIGQIGLDIAASGIGVLTLSPEDFGEIAKNISKWGLDFDDAYQYTVAKKRGLSIVSFDADFDKTDLVRIEPR